MHTETVRKVALECGFELAGVARAEPVPTEVSAYAEWARNGYAGEMRYLTDHCAGLRSDPRLLLPSARSVVSVGKLYNSPAPYSTEFGQRDRAWISRYAWGEDYHVVIRTGLERMAAELRKIEAFESKICVDTAPLLERTYARQAGLGWIGRNTCLINQEMGSWFFLGELLVSLDLEPDAAPPDRCGTCTRCIDACPTMAISPEGVLDSRRCISYFTIELRGAIPEEHRPAVENNVFGCDICQDVCPWNKRAPETLETEFADHHHAPPLERLATLTEEEFRAMFRSSPVKRSKYSGFLRNVAIAMGATRLQKFRGPLERLAESEEAMVAEHARWSLDRLNGEA